MDAPAENHRRDGHNELVDEAIGHEAARELSPTAEEHFRKAAPSEVREYLFRRAIHKDHVLRRFCLRRARGHDDVQGVRERELSLFYQVVVGIPAEDHIARLLRELPEAGFVRRRSPARVPLFRRDHPVHRHRHVENDFHAVSIPEYKIRKRRRKPLISGYFPRRRGAASATAMISVNSRSEKSGQRVSVKCSCASATSHIRSPADQCGSPPVRITRSTGGRSCVQRFSFTSARPTLPFFFFIFSIASTISSLPSYARRKVRCLPVLCL